eukprot:m.105515 g.105515  ORF g.105515 m.105515 type:complete len:319 (-) comp51649_c0_seq1:79-1035(-)
MPLRRCTQPSKSPCSTPCNSSLEPLRQHRRQRPLRSRPRNLPTANRCPIPGPHPRLHNPQPPQVKTRSPPFLRRTRLLPRRRRSFFFPHRRQSSCLIDTGYDLLSGARSAPGFAAPAGFGGPMANDPIMQAMSDPAMQQMMMQQLDNPLMQGMMRELAANPDLMRAQIAANPLLASNPAMRQQMELMMQNPALMQMMMDPNVMRMGLQMQQSMQQSGQAPSFASLFGAPPGVVPPAPVAAVPTAAAPATTPPANPFAALFGGQPRAPAQPPAANYTAELEQMRAMGFYDDAANLRALTATQGNVSAAVERILAAFGMS